MTHYRYTSMRRLQVCFVGACCPHGCEEVFLAEDVKLKA